MSGTVGSMVRMRDGEATADRDAGHPPADGAHTDDGELISRLRVIESQPLAARAAAYAALREDLARRLDAEPATPA